MLPVTILMWLTVLNSANNSLLIEIKTIVICGRSLFSSLRQDRPHDYESTDQSFFRCKNARMQDLVGQSPMASDFSTGNTIHPMLSDESMNEKGATRRTNSIM